MTADSLTVNEIFYSIQGEAGDSGRPCAFVRLTACDLRCRWCDTEYAFHQGDPMTIAQIVARIEEFGCRLVELTGGEPLLQPLTPKLVETLLDAGYEVIVETGGHRDVTALDRRARLIVDLKCPGSGEVEANRWENLSFLNQADDLKFVIADRADYEWARSTVEARRLSEYCTVFFSPVHGELEPGELAAWILEDKVPARLQVQLHKLLWGAEQRGV